MYDLPATLFLRTDIGEEGMIRILSFFGPLTIFQPWHMDPSESVSRADDLGVVKKIKPPESLNPGEGFISCLSEYKRWMTDHPGKGYMGFLKADQLVERKESTTWEIRQALRKANEVVPPIEERSTLRWHLILHLAQDIENQIGEADRALKDLKMKKPPLKDILEEDEETRSLFEDMPPFISEPSRPVYPLGDLFEAWMALFGRTLSEHEILVTVDRRTMDYVSELWNNDRQEDTDNGGMISFRYPDLSNLTLDGILQGHEKSIENDPMKDLKSLILDIWKDPIVNLSELDRCIKKTERSFPWQDSGGYLNMKVRYLHPLLDGDLQEKNRVLKYLSGKTIILMEDSPIE